MKVLSIALMQKLSYCGRIILEYLANPIVCTWVVISGVGSY